MEAQRELVFSLGYFIVAVCLVVPPREFVSLGLTVQNLFSSYLGMEDLHFISFHLKRTAVTILFHSLLPLGEYILPCNVPGCYYFLRNATIHVCHALTLYRCITLYQTRTA
jgi:hypothetical protein